VRQHLPELQLVKVGGTWTEEQQATLAQHCLADQVLHLTSIERSTLACLYRRARLVLMPSAAEGFGLPVLEALACHAPVLASDLPVFHEVGGTAVRYAPVGDVAAWTENALEMLQNPERGGSAQERGAQANRFSWQRHAEVIAETYVRLAQ
jgi:glycosyltransferase involved in cell wall biosynthesis